MYEQGGYEYLKKEFPKMDYLKGCVIIPDDELNNPEITKLSYEELAELFVRDIDDAEL